MIGCRQGGGGRSTGSGGGGGGGPDQDGSKREVDHSGNPDETEVVGAPAKEKSSDWRSHQNPHMIKGGSERRRSQRLADSVAGKAFELRILNSSADERRAEPYEPLTRLLLPAEGLSAPAPPLYCAAPSHSPPRRRLLFQSLRFGPFVSLLFLL